MLSLGIAGRTHSVGMFLAGSEAAVDRVID